MGENAIFNHYELKGNSGSYLIYRMFNVVGTSGFPDIDSEASAGYDRLFAALESGKIIIYGNDYRTIDQTCERDYVALKDVCRAYINGVGKFYYGTYNIREVVNICTGMPYSVKRIINVWNDISFDFKSIPTENIRNLSPVTYTYGPRREGDPAIVYGANDKADSVIGWAPSKKIEDIIRDLAYDKKI